MMITFEKTLEEVLKASKYDYLTGRRERFSEKVMNALLDFIKKILESLNININFDSRAVNADMIFNIFIVIFIIMIFAIIIFISMLIIKRRKKSKIISDIFDELKQTTMGFEEITALADQYENNKDFRQAVRYQYLALLLIISDKNIIYIPDSMTGGQFLKEVKKNVPEYYEGVNNTVNMFYLLWFGNKSVTWENYVNYKAVYTQTIKEVMAHE
ncbi:MAG: hypothetical protein E7234_11230 [Lachnospiraceae bacterium]|nr:hypothetical protein [Lachnospiraceae bacterium]